jgi:hypothetical protein
MVVLHEFYARTGDKLHAFGRSHANTLLKCVIIKGHRYARYDIKHVLLTRTVHILPRYGTLDEPSTHAIEVKLRSKML